MLPHDVLSIVFHLSLPDHEPCSDPEIGRCSPADDPDSRYKISRSQAPLNVSATCQLWRATALSTPSLWTRLCVVYVPTQSQQAWFDRCFPPMLETCISRSGQQPLSIFIKTYRSPNDVKARFKPLYAVLPWLLSCRHRWRSLSIRTPERQVPLWRGLLFYGTPPAQRLQVVDIRDTSPTFRSSLIFPPETATALPVLEHLQFDGKIIHVDGPLKKLKSLMARLDLCLVWYMFPRLTQLEVLAVTCNSSLSEDRDPQLVHLPNLKTLNLEVKHANCLEVFRRDQFLTHVVMPCLTDLRVELNGPTSSLSYVLHNISILLDTSQPVLRSLEICSSLRVLVVHDHERSMLLNIFLRSPSLCTLEVPGAAMGIGTINKLARTGLLLPSLERLFLHARLLDIAEEGGAEMYLSALRNLKLIRSRGGLSIHYRDETWSHWEELE